MYLVFFVQDKLKCAERKVVTVLQTLKKRKRMLQNAQVPQMTSMPLLAQVTSMVQGVAIPSSSSPAHRRLDNAQDMQMQNSSAGPPVQPMNMTSSGQNASGRLRTTIPPRQSPISVQTSPQLGGFRVDGLISGNTTVPRRWRNQADAMTQEKIVGPSQMASKPPERQSNQQSSTMTVRDMISMVRSSSQTVTEGAVSHPRPTLSLASPIPTALSSSTNDHAAIPQHPTQTGPPHIRPMEGPIVIDDEPNNVRAPPTSTRTTSWTRPNTDGSFQPTQGATTPGAFSSPALRLVSTRGSVSQGVPGRGSGITSIQPSTGTFADSSVPTGRPGTFRSAGSTTENRNHVNEVVDGGPVPPRSLPAGSLRSPNTQHPPSSKEMPSAAPVVQEIAPSTDAFIDLTLDEDRMHQGNAARRAPTARNQLPASSRGHPPLLPHGSQVSPNRGPVSSTQGVRSVQLASGGSHLPPPVPAHPPPPPQPVHLAPPAPPPPPSLVESDVISTLRTTRFPNAISNVRMPRVSQPSHAARITQPSSVFPLTRGPPALLNVTNSAQLRPMMTHSVSVVSVPSTNSTSPRNIPEFSSRPAQSNISSYRRIAPSQSVVCPKQMSLGSNNFVRPNFQPAMPRHPPPSYMGVSQTVTGIAPVTHGASLIDTLPVRMQYEQRGSSTQTAGMRGSAQPSGPVVPPSSQHILQMVGGREVAASYALPFPNSRFGSFPGPGISQSSTTGIPQSVATVRQHPVTQQVDPALIPLQIANTQTSLAASVTFTNTSAISAGCNRTVVPSLPTLNPSAQTSLMGPPPATCGPPPAQAPPSEASIRHPPPLPNTPPLSVPIPHEAMGTLPPPRPLLKLGRADNQGAIVLQWSVAEPVQESTTPHRAPAESYHIYAYHEDIQQGAATQWKKIGDVQALPLPMACTLTQFMVGSRYYFTVRAKDAFGRFSPFCEPQCADLKA
uniref:Fibronectin type-III domain-containing protein n=1 Tax=Eptatretus burgeri TaxID=7764 RepID=A0A8C4QS30_EPTBU